MAFTARTESEVKEYFDEPDELQKKIKKLAELIKKSKYFVVYTGAGISTSCGIADFRSGLNTVLDTGAGKWAKEAAVRDGKLSKQEAKNCNNTQKKKISRFSTFKAVPSQSHMALVALAKAGILKHLVSQNVDGLHIRSGFPIEKLSELHGNSTLEECSLCDKVYMRDFRCRNKAILPTGTLARIKYITDQIQNDLQNNSKYSCISDDDKKFIALQISQAYNFIQQQKTQLTANKKKTNNDDIEKTKNKITQENKEFQNELLNNWEKILNKLTFKLPRYLHNTGRFCSIKKCNGQLTDTIINFGESLPRQTLKTAENESDKADLYLVLGSSCTVTPAANMPKKVGMKWKEEGDWNENYYNKLLKDFKEQVHNLVICNLQKTPLHHLCSLPIYAKIDDVMCGLMKELNLSVPKWYLTRYMKLCVSDIGNRYDERELCISGVDRDGTVFQVFKSVILRNNGKRIRKVINNKENRSDEFNYIVPIWDIDDSYNENDEKDDNNNGFFKKYSVDKTIGLSVELEFYGHYEEPKLIVCLNEFLDEYVQYEGEIVIKIIMDPLTKEWCVPNKKQQMEDKDVKLLWCIGKEKENENNDIKKDE